MNPLRWVTSSIVREGGDGSLELLRGTRQYSIAEPSTAAAMRRAIALLDGHRTRADVIAALSDELDADDADALLDFLLERKLATEADPSAPRRGAEVAEALQALLYRWRREAENPPGYARYLEGQANRSWILGALIEASHVVAGQAVEARFLSERYPEVAARVRLNERLPQKYRIYEAIAAVGLDVRLVHEAPPLVETAALVNVFNAAAATSALHYTAALAVCEKLGTPSPDAMTFERALREHYRLDAAADAYAQYIAVDGISGDVLGELLAPIGVVSYELTIELAATMRVAFEANLARWAGIDRYYIDGSEIPRPTIYPL